MKRKKRHFLIILALVIVSAQSPAEDDLSDPGTGSFSTDQSQAEEPEEQNDEYNSFGENLYNQNEDTSPYELEKKKNQTDDSHDQKRNPE